MKKSFGRGLGDQGGGLRDLVFAVRLAALLLVVALVLLEGGAALRVLPHPVVPVPLVLTLPLPLLPLGRRGERRGVAALDAEPVAEFVEPLPANRRAELLQEELVDLGERHEAERRVPVALGGEGGAAAVFE